MKQNKKETNIVTHDFITAPVINFLNFLHKNKTAVFIVIIILAVAGAGAGFYFSYRSNVYEDSWKQYYLSTVSEGPAKDGALALLSGKYKDTAAEFMARYEQAGAFYDAGKYGDAAKIFEDLSKFKNKNLAAFAQLSLANALYAAGETQKAVTAAQNFINNNEDHFASAQAYLIIAMGQEKLGKKDDAIKTYTLITQRFAPGYYDTFAQNKLKILK